MPIVVAAMQRLAAYDVIVAEAGCRTLHYLLGQASASARVAARRGLALSGGVTALVEQLLSE